MLLIVWITHNKFVGRFVQMQCQQPLAFGSMGISSHPTRRKVRQHLESAEQEEAACVANRENNSSNGAYITMSSANIKAMAAMATNNPTRSTTELTDEQILLEYRSSGDQGLFSVLVQRYERELYSYLRRYLGNAEHAEDAFQATFLQLHLKCDQFEEGRRLRPWLYMIATNKAIDLQRRNKRHQIVSLNGSQAGEDTGQLMDMLMGDEPSPLSRMNQLERGDWVTNTMEALPEHLKLVVHLVYYQGLKYREAAEVLSIPVGTVKSRLHAAITKMTSEWNDSHDEEF